MLAHLDADEGLRYSLSTRHATPVVDRDVDHRALAKTRWKRRQPWPLGQPFLFTARGTKVLRGDNASAQAS
jgi:hypothetical protein